MGVFVKLQWQDKTFDLNNKTSGRYYVDEDFAPPRAGDLERGYAFNVIIQGSGSAEIERAISNLQSFLDLAQDPHADLYLLYKDDDTIPFEPLYGQFGRFKRYKILPRVFPGENTVQQQIVSYSGGGQLGVKGKLISNTIALRIASDSEGLRQVAAQGKGGLLANWYGKADGKPRGLMVPEDLTNKFTNPVFGSATAWDNNWTLGAKLQSKQIVGDLEPDRVFFDRFSARLTNDLSAGNNIFTQSLDAGGLTAHIIGCVVQLPDKSAPNETIIAMYYNGSVETGGTITALGDDGWYLLYKDITGVVGATTVGVRLGSSATVYVDGFFMYETGRLTAPFYGDMLGCAWSGTRHDSTSTRGQGYVRVDFESAANLGEGTWVFDWTPDYPETDLSASIDMLDTGTLELIYSNGNNRFEFTDGTGTAHNNTGVSWSAGDEFTFHCTYSYTNGLRLYVNGTAGTDAGTYTAPAAPTWIYVGSSNVPSRWCEGTIRGVTFYEREMTAAQVTADYTARALLIADDESTDPFPIFWTKDGDNILDNENDGSTDANWGVLLNVGGDQVADLEWLITPSYGGVLSSGEKFASWLGNTPIRAVKYLNPDLVYSDSTLPALTAGSNTEKVNIVDIGESYFSKINLFWGGQADGSADAITIYGWYNIAGTTSGRITTDTFSVTLPASTGEGTLWHIGGLEYSNTKINRDRYVAGRSFEFGFVLADLGFSATTHLIQIIVGQFTKVTTLFPTAIPDSFSLLPGGNALGYKNTNEVGWVFSSEGDDITAVPLYYNIITSFMGDSGVDRFPSGTQTINSLYVTPVYRIT